MRRDFGILRPCNGRLMMRKTLVGGVCSALLTNIVVGEHLHNTRRLPPLHDIVPQRFHDVRLQHRVWLLQDLLKCIKVLGATLQGPVRYEILDSPKVALCDGITQGLRVPEHVCAPGLSMLLRSVAMRLSAQGDPP